MSRREIVVLVSRALAVIQFVTAMLEISYLPQDLMSVWEHASPLRTMDLYNYWSRYYIEGTLSLILRIAFLLFATWFFWQCGPKVENLLLPVAAMVQEPAHLDAADGPPTA